MELQTAIPLINYALRGTDDDAPEAGTDDYNHWVAILNRKKDEFFRDASANWVDDYEVRSVGTITASAALSFDLDTDFLFPTGDSDASGVYVVDTDGNRHDLTLVKPNERSRFNQAVFIAGMNPRKLYFTAEITATDQLVGGELFISGHFLPSDLAEATDMLPFPDPQWGVLATAAELADKDLVYEEKYEMLLEKANNLYRQMVLANNSNVHGRKTKTSVSRIRGF